MADTESRVETAGEKDADEKGTAPRPGMREWRILAVVLVGSFMAVLDSTSRLLTMPTVIEHNVPDVPDRQVKLADGFPDLAGSGMIAHQSQRRFERQSCGEQPAHHDVVHARRDAIAILH